MNAAAILVLLALPFPALQAGDAGAPANDPKVLGKVVAALETSGIDHLTSKGYGIEGREYSYHLTTVDYLGTIQRDGKAFTVATAQFVRSSRRGSQNPNARGHGFIILLDPDYRIATHARLDFHPYLLQGEKVILGDTIVIDFSDRDIRIRHRGWPVDSGFLAYPFADKITDEEWECGSFRLQQEKPAEQSAGPNALPRTGQP